MNDHRIGTAPNYTNAALIMLGINLLWIFFLLWAVWGFVPVLVIALLLNHGIDRLTAYRISRGKA